MDHSKGMACSATQARIDGMCAVWLHKPTNKRYYVAYSAASMSELHGLDGGTIYASDEQLANAEIWSRQP